MVTETVTVPAAWLLVTAVMVVADVTWKLKAVVVPKCTAEAPLNPVPVIVTLVPPLVEPVVGVKEVTVGGATKVKSEAEVPVP